MIRNFGWIPDLPDLRDQPHKFAAKFRAAQSVNELPPRTTNKERCGPVRNQGNTSSCTGFSTTSAIEQLNPSRTVYAPLYAYYNGRKEQGWEHDDAGAYLRDVVKTMARRETGIAPESSWRFVERKVNRAPSQTAVKAGQRFVVIGYHRCQTLLEVLSALAEGMPVVGGFSCYRSMFTPEVDASGRIPMPGPRDILDGAHAVHFVDYEMSERGVLWKNSWGEGWGMGGYGILPFDYFESRDLSDDFWALTAGD